MLKNARIIINFHGLGVPHANVPMSELPYWLPIDRFQKIIDQVVLRRERGDDIAVTFDDGNRSDLEIAAPYLAAKQLVATFFVLTGRLNDRHYLSHSDLANLRSMGMVVGLHGRDHVDWRGLGDEAREVEILRSRTELENLIGGSVRTLSIPFGAYDRRLMSYLKQQDFDHIYTSDGGRAWADDRIQPRASLRSDMSDAELTALLDGQIHLGGRLRRTVRRTLKEYII
jgi:peptidoglycan/xylan/chitin deacetylase (PgdA/CDA1 family)